jgi:hypothetical protein
MRKKELNKSEVIGILVKIINMDKVLNTPEFIEKIISYLPVKSQFTVSGVNRTWRLEARRQLYINRRKTIDELVSKQRLRPAVDFIYALNLNKMDELEALIIDYKKRRDDLFNKYELETNSEQATLIISELKTLIDGKIMYLIHYINVCKDNTILITEEAKNQNIREWEEQAFRHLR